MWNYFLYKVRQTRNIKEDKQVNTSNLNNHGCRPFDILIDFYTSTHLIC